MATKSKLSSVDRAEVVARYEARKGQLDAWAHETWIAYAQTIRAEKISDLTVQGNRLSVLIGGKLVEVFQPGQVQYEDCYALIRALLQDRPELVTRLDDPQPEIDAAVVVGGLRFRINIGYCYEGLTASLRPMPESLPELASIGFDDAPGQALCKFILSQRSGLVLVVGPTGSGKSSTMAAFLNEFRHRVEKIYTIEDPIEYVVPDEIGSAVVTQREVGVDVDSFPAGMRSSLRSKPNVILIGEMRDSETVEIALEAAETGHLVFATLHADDCVQAPRRLLRKLPEASRDQARTVLSRVLRAIIAQRLLPRRGGGRVAWREILTVADPSVRSLIGTSEKEAKEFEFPTVMNRSRAQGMVTFARHLEEIRPHLDPEVYREFAVEE